MDGFLKLLDWIDSHFLGVVLAGLLLTGAVVRIIDAIKGRKEEEWP